MENVMQKEVILITATQGITTTVMVQNDREAMQKVGTKPAKKSEIRKKKISDVRNVDGKNKDENKRRQSDAGKNNMNTNK